MAASLPAPYSVTFSSTPPAMPASTKPMSRSLPGGAAQIALLTAVNGIAIAEIEKRAQPGAYSKTGFLGINESFPKVLMDDCTAVSGMGMTHIEIADLLQKVRDFSYKHFQIWRKSVGGSKIEILGQEKFIFTFQGKKISCKIVLLQPRRSEFINKELFAQYSAALKISNSLWEGAKITVEEAIKNHKLWNDISDVFLQLSDAETLEYARKLVESPDEQILLLKKPSTVYLSAVYPSLFNPNPNSVSCHVEWQVFNAATGKNVLITEEIIQFVRDLGFFVGGGKSNPNRLDPLQVMSVFTGKPVSEQAASAAQEEATKKGAAAATPLASSSSQSSTKPVSANQKSPNS